MGGGKSCQGQGWWIVMWATGLIQAGILLAWTFYPMGWGI